MQSFKKLLSALCRGISFHPSIRMMPTQNPVWKPVNRTRRERDFCPESGLCQQNAPHGLTHRHKGFEISTCPIKGAKSLLCSDTFSLSGKPENRALQDDMGLPSEQVGRLRPESLGFPAWQAAFPGLQSI
jgi:hypothetical protein